MRAAALDDPALDALHRVADEVGLRLAAATDHCSPFKLGKAELS